MSDTTLRDTTSHTRQIHRRGRPRDSDIRLLDEIQLLRARLRVTVEVLEDFLRTEPNESTLTRIRAEFVVDRERELELRKEKTVNPTIRVVVALPGKPSTVQRVPNTLAALQEIIGGYLEMFASELSERGLHAFCNEDGKRLELAPNFHGNFDTILGPVIVSKGNGDGDEIGLTEDEATWAIHVLNRWRTRR